MAALLCRKKVQSKVVFYAEIQLIIILNCTILIISYKIEKRLGAEL